MMVRERLTGQAPPPAAKKLVDLWRPFIEDRAGRGLDQLERVLEDQRKFGDAVHDLLESLDMGEDRSSSEEEEDGEEGDQDGTGHGSAPRRRASEIRSMIPERSRSRSSATGRPRAVSAAKARRREPRTGAG